MIAGQARSYSDEHIAAIKALFIYRRRNAAYLFEARDRAHRK